VIVTDTAAGFAQKKGCPNCQVPPFGLGLTLVPFWMLIHA
jgi:hypothetical protein